LRDAPDEPSTIVCQHLTHRRTKITDMADDDPFGVFSDDEDDSYDAQPEETEATIIAKSLMGRANVKINESAAPPGTSTTTTVNSVPRAGDEVDLSRLKLLQLSWPPPLYKGPMELVSALPVGGGRGFVASRRLKPGTLILVEEPMMEWPPEQLGKKLDLMSVRHLLEHPNASRIIQDMEDLHPTKEDVDLHSDDEANEEQISKMVTMLQSECPEAQISDLVQFAKENDFVTRDSSPIRATDVLRLLLSLRYNGLESGVYRDVAMLNHSCHPNCAKLLPPGLQSYSEVRTTRVIQPGESLTISYVSRVMSHESRRKHLWEQHRFDIGTTLQGEELEIELVGNSLPSSSIQRSDETSPTRRIENATHELETMLSEMQADVENGMASTDVWETLKALELTSLELYQESVQQLQNDHHILLIPCLVVHLEACDLVQKAPSLSLTIQLGILSRLVLTAIRLLPLQTTNLGSDHFDLARTNLDLANSIGELLSRSPKRLYEMNLLSLKNFEEWSVFEHKLRKEHNRIKALYPHDAESFIKTGSLTDQR
jgi:hypothetical protein